MYATWSSLARLARTSTPTACDVTSGPLRRSRSSTLPTTRSTCSGETGRFLMAFRMPLSSLARSNGSLEPSRLTTTRPTSSTRSNDVYRRPQDRHSRRRRIAEPPSADRESTTRSSSASHQGHRMIVDHNMLWRREPYHLASSSEARDDERLTGYHGTDVDAVPRDDGVDQRPRIGTVGRRLGDRPDRVAGLHDDHLFPPPSRLHLRARCLPVTPERPGDRSGQDDRHGHAPERG